MSNTLTQLSGVASTVITSMNYLGLWNASTNTPALASGTGAKGSVYKVSVAGTTSLDGIAVWAVGDEVIFDGTTWDKLSGQSAVDLTSAQTVAGVKTFSAQPVAPSIAFTAKNVVSSNGAAGVTCVAGYNAYIGTNATTVAFTFPAAAGLQDGTVVSVYTQAAVSVASTWVSVGATFLTAPATLTAGQVATFIYHTGTTNWIPYN